MGRGRRKTCDDGMVGCWSVVCCWVRGWRRYLWRIGGEAAIRSVLAQTLIK